MRTRLEKALAGAAILGGLFLGATGTASAQSAAPSVPPMGNGRSSNPSLSADGLRVAFASIASNLVAGDTNVAPDVFVKDLATGTLTRASVSPRWGQAGGHSFGPSLSADGRFVAFESIASNLVAGDTNGSYDVFVKDLAIGTLTRASVDNTGGQAGGHSYVPSLSADGRFIAFGSDASNLVAGDTNVAPDVFVKDLATGAITRASVDNTGAQSNSSLPYDPSLSADGRFVAFAGSFDIFVKGLPTGSLVLVSRPRR